MHHLKVFLIRIMIFLLDFSKFIKKYSFGTLGRNEVFHFSFCNWDWLSNEIYILNAFDIFLSNDEIRNVLGQIVF